MNYEVETPGRGRAVKCSICHDTGWIQDESKQGKPLKAPGGVTRGAPANVLVRCPKKCAKHQTEITL